MKFKNDNDIISFILDDNWHISTEFLRQKNWEAVPVPNQMELIESEWLSQGIFLMDHGKLNNEYVEMSFEFKGEVTKRTIKNTQENIIESNFQNSFNYLIITNENLDFIYFKNQDNLYHIFCGKPDFVQKCVNCSLEMSKKIFFSYGVDSFEKHDDEYTYLTDIWAMYQQI